MTAKFPRIDALTGVRGFAATWVVVHHGTVLVGGGESFPQWLQRFIAGGWLAVDLFFILSGFVISYAYLAEMRPLTAHGVRRFLVLRLARIYPAHLFVALLWLLPLWASVYVLDQSLSEGIQSSFNLKTFLAAVLLLNGIGIEGTWGWNLASWSVGAEWIAYLCFPLLAWGLWRLDSTPKIALMAGLSLAVPWGLAYWVNGGTQYMLPPEGTVIRVVFEFLLGCCLYLLWTRAVLARYAPLIAVAACALLLPLLVLERPVILDGLIVVGFAALLYGLAHSGGLLARVLASPAMVFLGEVSYSVYLIHALLVVLLGKIFHGLAVEAAGDPLVACAILALYVALSILAGTVLYFVVERPGRQAIRALVERGGPPPRRARSAV